MNSKLQRSASAECRSCRTHRRRTTQGESTVGSDTVAKSGGQLGTVATCGGQPPTPQLRHVGDKHRPHSCDIWGTTTDPTVATCGGQALTPPTVATSGGQSGRGATCGRATCGAQAPAITSAQHRLSRIDYLLRETWWVRPAVARWWT